MIAADLSTDFSNESAAECQSLNRLLDWMLVESVADVGNLDKFLDLANTCRDTPLGAYAAALAIIYVHEVNDDTRALHTLNARLLARDSDRSLAQEFPPSLSTQRDVWALILAHGRALAALHSESTPESIAERFEGLIALLSAAASTDARLQRLRLRALTSALSYSQLNGNFPVRLELDAIAASCLSLLNGVCVEIPRWWAERALIEIFTFRTERRAEPPIETLLGRSEQALERHPDPIARFKQWRNTFEWARLENDAPRATEALESLQHAHAAVGARRRAYGIVVLRAKAALAIDAGDSVSAERFTRDAIAVADDIGAAANLRMAIWTTLVLALVAQDRSADAAEAAETAASYALSQHREIITALSHLLHAKAKWLTHYALAMEHLKLGMQLARRANYSQFLMSAPVLAAWLAARALEHDVETAFVADVIVRRRLLPPLGAASNWPWVVRIRLLGGSFVERDGANLAGASKAQQKPLDIIQSLAIAGARGLDRANLARAIYGSALLDSPATLNMAISRARRLLGDDSLIKTEGGRVSLDAHRVYVDLWEMQAIASTSDEEAASHCSRLLHLYAGPLLYGNVNAEKHRMTAATLRDRFVALVVSLTSKLANDQAVDILREAIAREPNAEPLYRALIERYGQRGDAADAVEAYRQCELALAKAYGVAPSDRTQRLIESIRKHSLANADKRARP